ncbi:MAG: MFS transporter [Promethearchaeota archaeon]|nr:MAG: MFS transporter [Candidatus Lokiarchaeota archaeon]
MKNNNQHIKGYGYRRFIAGQITSLLGSEVVSFVIGLYLARTYGNSFYFAISMILQFLPRVLLSPFAGVWADQGDRKKIVISSDMVQAVITTALVVLFNLNAHYSWAFWVSGEIYILFGFILFRATFQAIQGPSVSSILPSIVPREKLSRLNGLFQFSQGAAGIIAPLVAGFLMNFMPVYNLLWIDTITFLIALSLIFTVNIPKRVKPEVETPIQIKTSRFTKFIQDFSEGVSVTKKITGLSALLTIFVITNIFVSPINTLSDILMITLHGATNTEYIAASVSFAAGMITGSVISTLVNKWNHISRTLLIGVLGLYTGLFIIGITPIGLSGSLFEIRTSFWMIIAGGFITTLGIPIFSTIAVTMIQLSVPIEKMGRFSGFMNAIMGIFTPIGYLLSGYLGTIIYIPYVIMGASVIAILLMILMWSVSKIGALEPLINEKLAMVPQQAQAAIEEEQKFTENQQDEEHMSAFLEEDQ